MDKEDVITEVSETRSPGDGLRLEDGKPIETPEAAAEPETEEEGPWNEYNIVEGLKSTLNSGFMSDLAVTVQEETFQCHAYILGMASPKLAKMIKTNPRELQLPDVLPSNFRSLLEIIYSGAASELETDLVKALHVRRDAQELKVYKAVDYCTQQLRVHLSAWNVCSVLDTSELVNETEMKSCIKILQEETNAVLKSENFLDCDVATIELILKQDFVHNIPEVDMYLALNYWAVTKEISRQTFGSLLNLIRFHTMKPKETVINLEKLLTNIEKQDLFHCCKPENTDENTDETRNELRKRHTTWSTEHVHADAEEINLGGSDQKHVTAEELLATPPLRISVNEDAFLIGVKPYSSREGKTHRNRYMEDVEVTLKDDKGNLIATATFRGEVTLDSRYDVKFPHAVQLCADVTYELHFSSNVPDVNHYTDKHTNGVHNTKTSLKINLLEEQYSPIDHLLMAPIAQ